MSIQVVVLTEPAFSLYVSVYLFVLCPWVLAFLSRSVQHQQSVAGEGIGNCTNDQDPRRVEKGTRDRPSPRLDTESSSRIVVGGLNVVTLSVAGLILGASVVVERVPQPARACVA